jgi:hypothetical protein
MNPYFSPQCLSPFPLPERGDILRILSADRRDLLDVLELAEGIQRGEATLRVLMPGSCS